MPEVDPEATYSVNPASLTSPSSNGCRLTCMNYVNILAFAINVVVTYGIGVGGIFDLPTNDELSAKYQTLVTPIGWAFAIWGVIFGMQALWAIIPLVVTKQRDNPLIFAVGYNYVAVCVAQAFWTVTFSLEIIWASLICMLLILLFLWRIVWCTSETNTPYKGSLANYVLWRFPFAIHAGWITAASFVNANVLLVDLQVSANLQFYAALVSLFLILVIATTTTISLDLTIPLVLAWALFGIFVELSDPEESIEEAFSQTQMETALWGSLVFGIMIAFGFVTGLLWQCCRKRPSVTEDDRSAYLRAN